MFKKLIDFGYHRTPVQAVGFYIAWLITIALASGLLSYLIQTTFVLPSSFSQGFSNGIRIGNYVAVLSTFAIAFAIASAKRKLTNFVSIVFILLSALLAVFGGGLLGLIIPAYMTTETQQSSAQKKTASS